MGADMQVNMRNKIDQLGRRGKMLEGKILKQAGAVMAKGIASNIGRSTKDQKHMQDNILVSNVKSSKFGERSVQVGAVKDISFRLKFLEFGTSKMSAQAPMEKGVSQSKGEVAEVLKSGMKGIMKL